MLTQPLALCICDPVQDHALLRRQRRFRLHPMTWSPHLLSRYLKAFGSMEASVIRKGGWSGVRFCCITRAVPRQSVRQTSDNDGSRKEREDGTGWLRVGPIGLVIPSPAATSRDSISGGG